MNEINKLKAITQALRIARTCPSDWTGRQLYPEMLKSENKLSVQYLPNENNKHSVVVHMMATAPDGHLYKLSIDTYI